MLCGLQSTGFAIQRAKQNLEVKKMGTFGLIFPEELSRSTRISKTKVTIVACKPRLGPTPLVRSPGGGKNLGVLVSILGSHKHEGIRIVRKHIGLGQ